MISEKENDVNNPRQKYIGVVEYTSTGEQAACYASAIFYGGYCWYIKLGPPPSSSYEKAKREAVIMFPEKDLKINEIYLEPK